MTSEPTYQHVQYVVLVEVTAIVAPMKHKMVETHLLLLQMSTVVAALLLLLLVVAQHNHCSPTSWQYVVLFERHPTVCPVLPSLSVWWTFLRTTETTSREASRRFVNACLCWQRMAYIVLARE
jgi:hypothetical protein